MNFPIPSLQDSSPPDMPLLSWLSLSSPSARAFVPAMPTVLVAAPDHQCLPLPLPLPLAPTPCLYSLPQPLAFPPCPCPCLVSASVPVTSPAPTPLLLPLHMSMPLLLVLLLGLLSQAQNLSSPRPMSLKIAPCLLLVKYLKCQFATSDLTSSYCFSTLVSINIFYKGCLLFLHFVCCLFIWQCPKVIDLFLLMASLFSLP